MRICAATGNAGKLRELRRILEAQGHEVVSQKELGITIEPDETGTTFEANALIKAETICKASGLPTIADDSGLCVDALDGAPGVYSARYCGHHGDDEANNDKLLENMKDVPAGQRGAKFVAAVCFILPTGQHLTCRGECPGRVAFERLAGDYGFGYDPLFIPDECGVGKTDKRPNSEGRSYAQLTPDEKDAISHRGNALAEMEKELPEFLKPGDCLILNNSRVLPARLLGQRLPGGGACEVLLLIDRGEKTWECIVRPGKHLRKGAKMQFGGGELTAEVTDVLPDGNRMVKFNYEGIFLEVLERLGKMPLPPYIKEELADQERYQTVYSKVEGSAAAPTAGLHFTPELLEKIQKQGVNIGYVTLHVGLGTFRPVKEDDIEQHDMHSEYCVIPLETAALINETRKNGGRVICVGTTSCRTLESWAQEDGHMEPSAGWTNIYIYPGYRFKVMDALITNFHLPQSTLIMLVSALAGREHVLHAYEEAVKERYRFFSFGDSMLLY